MSATTGIHKAWKAEVMAELKATEVSRRALGL